MNNHDGNPGKKGSSSSRRSFIKKAVYTAPALMVLGGLATSADARRKDPGSKDPRDQDPRTNDFGPPPSLTG